MNVRDELKNMSFQYFDDGVFYIDKYIRDILSRFIIVPKESARVIEITKDTCINCPLERGKNNCGKCSEPFKIIIVETPNRKG